MINKLKSLIYGVPYKINNHWPYYCSNEPYAQLKNKGFEVGKVSFVDGKLIAMLAKNGYDFVYKITDIRKLKGGDFLYGTDKEYDLVFVARFKR